MSSYYLVIMILTINLVCRTTSDWHHLADPSRDICGFLLFKELNKNLSYFGHCEIFSQFKDINQNGFSKRKRKKILLIVLLIVLIIIFGKSKHLISMQFWYKIYITEVCYTSKSLKNFNCLKTELKTTITICTCVTTSCMLTVLQPMVVESFLETASLTLLKRRYLLHFRT